MIAIGTAVLSAAAAFIGSWLAARFALERFRSEKIWERRAAAYTTIFESLHDMEDWTSGAVANRDEKDVSRFLDAHSALSRRTASESWLLSDRFREKVESLSDVDTAIDDPAEFYGRIHRHIRSLTIELRAIARTDLAVK